MKFGLIDRIVELDSGKRIVAIKAVSLAEEYLAEHFPTFPVLPGVFMLECMAEAAAWIVREAEGFAHSAILLQSARGVTYKSFVAPGHLLRVEVTCLRLAREASEFTGVGFCENTEVVKGKFGLKHMNLQSRSPGSQAIDQNIIAEHRKRWALIRPPAVQSTA